MSSRTGVERDVPSSSSAMRVQIGDICCSIICGDGEVSVHLSELYGNFLSDRPADINIKLDVVEQFETAEMELALSQGRVIRGGNSAMAVYKIAEEESASTGHTVSVTVERCQFDPRLGFKIMNLLLPQAYYTAYRMKHGAGLPAMLVHSCGILRRGQVLMFAGPSEMGKTTVARLCGHEYGQVVNDEMLLLSGQGWHSGMLAVQGVPIVGGVAQRLNMTAPLACVLLLQQADRFTIRRLSRVEAFRRFLRQVIAPRDFDVDQNGTMTMLSKTAEFSDRVTMAARFYELQFALDRELLWRAVTELEESLMKGELVA